MDIRNAILKAADHIERNPHKFSYVDATNTPRPDGRGCFVGWVAYFMGEKAGQKCGSRGTDSPLCHKLFGVGFMPLIDRLRDLVPNAHHAELAPKALRLYADKYHPAERF